MTLCLKEGGGWVKFNICKNSDKQSDDRQRVKFALVEAMFEVKGIFD